MDDCEMTDRDEPRVDPVTAVGSLSEPTRRALYEHVSAATDAVGRDAAATAVGISRSLAAFHLDRLADDGLLDVEYRRLSGRTGPGAGRPAKLYRRSTAQVAITLPPRQYALAAEVLADAVDRRAPATRRAVADAARERGRQLGAPAAAGLGRRASRKRRIDALRQLLSSAGYEPYDDHPEIRVRNCPFHTLATAHVALVCGMNQELVAGAAEEIGVDVPVRLDPKPGECCVVVTT